MRAVDTRHRLALILPLLGLASCAQQPQRPLAPPPGTEVRYEAVADKSLPVYQMHASQVAYGAKIAPGNPVPIYPPSMLRADAPPVSVQALLIVGTDGRVSEVRMAADQADGAMAAYAAAVAGTVLQWRFEPLLISEWATRPDGSEYRTGAVAKPFSQTYVFRFSIKDGKPSVSMH